VSEEYYKPRRDPVYGQNTTLSNDTLMVFGIDFLKTAELKRRFSVYQSEGEDVKFLFLDKSNCMIYFSDPEKVRATLELNVKKNSSTAFKIE
jgi:hypothetical protein